MTEYVKINNTHLNFSGSYGEIEKQQTLMSVGAHSPWDLNKTVHAMVADYERKRINSAIVIANE